MAALRFPEKEYLQLSSKKRKPAQLLRLIWHSSAALPFAIRPNGDGFQAQSLAVEVVTGRGRPNSCACEATRGCRTGWISQHICRRTCVQRRLPMLGRRITAVPPERYRFSIAELADFAHGVPTLVHMMQNSPLACSARAATPTCAARTVRLSCSALPVGPVNTGRPHSKSKSAARSRRHTFQDCIPARSARDPRNTLSWQAWQKAGQATAQEHQNLQMCINQN